jgi:hypothetical protein
MMTEEPVYFTHEMQVAWISEHGDLPVDQVDAVLMVEWEYMVATGIAVKPKGAPEWELRYYEPGELNGAPSVVDRNRIARDAERLAGVPMDIALRVLDVEFDFLELRGLV